MKHLCISHIKNRSGSTLVTVMVALVILSMLAASALVLATAEIRQAHYTYNKTQAYYLARAGVDAVADYLMNNPENLSIEQMEERINNIVIGGLSDNTKLNEESSDYFTVSLTRETEYVKILATGYVNEDITATVELKMKRFDASDAAVILNGDMVMENGTQVYGSVVQGKNGGKIDEGHKGEIFGEKIYKSLFFTFPEFPVYPSGFTNNTNTSPNSLNKNTYYVNGLKFTNKDSITVTIDDSNDFIIRTKYLSLDQTSINIDGNGTGKLIIYVDGDGVAKTDKGKKYGIWFEKSDVNKDENSDRLEIYYNSGDFNGIDNNGNVMIKAAKGQNNFIHANMYVSANDFYIDQGINYNGKIYYNQTSDDGGLKLTNVSSSDGILIYAPFSSVAINNNFELKGIVVAGKLDMTNNAVIDSDDLYSSFFEENLIVGDYEKRQYK